MATPIISVEHLSKRYLVGHRSERRDQYDYTNLRDIVARELRNAARKAADVLRGRQVVQGDEVEEFWALKDVSFEVNEGEVIGIIGRNGAGKSTLLKILSRITEPTEGRITLRGRVASLLEVGTGFHPELSGRENIYLNGAILGMSRAEIRRKFDEIVAFAEVEKFLDTPVKRYSSGMYVRLAFAVAAHLEPEILVVDEVLAVGDAEFQKKCLGKMSSVARGGRTILFVSHNHSAIQRLCASSILLERGQISRFAPTKEVLAEYTHSSNSCHEVVFVDGARAIAPSGELKLLGFRTNVSGAIGSRESFSAIIALEVVAPIRGVVFGIGFNAVSGERLLSCDSDFNLGGEFSFSEPGKYEIEVIIPSLPLTPSPYALDVGCRTPSGRMLDEVKCFATLEVTSGETLSPSGLRPFATVCFGSIWRVAADRRVTV